MEDTNPSGSPAPVQETPAESQVSESQEGSEQLEGAEGEQPAAQPSKEEVKAEKKRYKQLQLKVDGEEINEDLPFEVDEEHAEYMKKNLQMSKVAQKRMQEAKQLQSNVERFVKELKGNTRETLKQMGIDPKEFAAAVLEDEIKRQQMSPEQLELQELRDKQKKIEEERKREKEDFDRRELERLQQQEYERIDTQMTQALEKSELPKERYVVKRIADYMLLGLQNGVNLSPDDVIPLVQEEIQSELQNLVKALGVDKAEKFIGKDILNSIRKKNIAKAKTPATAKAAIKDVGSKKVEEKPAEKIDMKKFFGV